jgi:hypothetical protein
MIVIGVMVALIPLIEWATQGLTFGHDFGSKAGPIITIVHILFYWGTFSLVGRLLPFKRADRTSLHPLIGKAFSVYRPIMVSMIGVSIALSVIEQYALIYPMILLLLGIIYSIYGRFSIPQISYIAWAYIAAALSYIYLSPNESSHLWMFFTTFQGLSLILMGLFLNRAEARTSEARA